MFEGRCSEIRPDDFYFPFVASRQERRHHELDLAIKCGDEVVDRWIATKLGPHERADLGQFRHIRVNDLVFTFGTEPSELRCHTFDTFDLVCERRDAEAVLHVLHHTAKQNRAVSGSAAAVVEDDAVAGEVGSGRTGDLDELSDVRARVVVVKLVDEYRRIRERARAEEDDALQQRGKSLRFHECSLGLERTMMEMDQARCALLH